MQINEKIQVNCLSVIIFCILEKVILFSQRYNLLFSSNRLLSYHKLNMELGDIVKYIFVMIMLLAVFLLFAQQNGFERLTAPKFKEILEIYKMEKTKFVLLDIRTLPEFESGHIEGAEMLDFYSKSFVQDLKALDKDLPYLIYCRSGNRTGQTLALMQKLGFKNISDLKNGINSWTMAGYEILE